MSIQKLFLLALAGYALFAIPALYAGCASFCTSNSTPFSTTTTCSTVCTKPSPCTPTPCHPISCHTSYSPCRTITTCYTRPEPIFVSPWPAYTNNFSFYHSSPLTRDYWDDDDDYVCVKPSRNRYSSCDDEYYAPKKSYTHTYYTRSYRDYDDDCDDYCDYVEDCD